MINVTINETISGKTQIERRDRKGMGIGTELMRAAAESLRRVAPARGVWLWVMEANVAARGFYDRLGARHVETVMMSDPGGGQAPNCRYTWSSPDALLGLGT